MCVVGVLSTNEVFLDVTDKFISNFFFNPIGQENCDALLIIFHVSRIAIGCEQ